MMWPSGTMRGAPHVSICSWSDVTRVRHVVCQAWPEAGWRSRQGPGDPTTRGEQDQGSLAMGREDQKEDNRDPRAWCQECAPQSSLVEAVVCP